MKRPRRTYRLHDDTQAAIEELSLEWCVGLGQVIEELVMREASQVWGRKWRERVRDRRERVCATAPDAGLQSDGAATSSSPDYALRA
jgi:hypothetical protein